MRITEGNVELPRPPQIREIDEAKFPAWLQEKADKDYKGNFNKAFLELQIELNQRKALVIVAALDETGKVIGYLGGSTQFPEWEGFEDETKSQYPRIYRTFTGIMKSLQKARENDMGTMIWQGPGNRPKAARFALVVWQHPEAHYQELEGYMQMTGIRYAGSPQQ